MAYRLRLVAFGEPDLQLEWEGIDKDNGAFTKRSDTVTGRPATALTLPSYEVQSLRSATASACRSTVQPHPRRNEVNIRCKISPSDPTADVVQTTQHA